ncbi:hypothetical protein Clacol_007369 [Clathrus columnatus]|uniref:RRM domain-containing protein n=1 Tax=Clathrus columnatus TaxID=1419009 RepID=A0AAV5AKA1_9AGAM|nr:hypothetical protein Clacol_007369 [Clathrus columnatus]
MADDAGVSFQNTFLLVLTLRPNDTHSQPVAIGIPVQDIQMSNGGDDGWGPSGDDRRTRNGGRSRSQSPGRARDSGRESGTNPGNNLHVSGLGTRIDNRDLEIAFSKYGRVQKAAVMYDPHTRESRGFGFVTMETAEEADAAVSGLNATDLHGKTITVEKMSVLMIRVLMILATAALMMTEDEAHVTMTVGITIETDIAGITIAEPENTTEDTGTTTEGMTIGGTKSSTFVTTHLPACIV